MLRFVLLSLLVLFSFAAVAQNHPIITKKSLGTNLYFLGNKRLNNRDLQLKLKSNAEATALMKQARTNNTFASIFSFAGGALIGYQLGAALGGGEPNWGVAGIGAGLIAVGIPFNTAYNRKSQSAVDIYNNSLVTGSYYFKPEFKAGFTGNGLGLLVQF